MLKGFDAGYMQHSYWSRPMATFPHLATVGTRGINLDLVESWNTVEPGEEGLYRALSLRFADGHIERFAGTEAAALQAYLDDMSVDVLDAHRDSIERSKRLQSEMLSAMGAVQ